MQLANSYPPVVHNPKLTACGLCLEQVTGSDDEAKRLIPVRPSWAEDDNSRVRARRICPYVGEIQVERNKDPLFAVAGTSNRPVVCSSQVLVVDRVAVVASAAEDHRALWR